MTAAFVSIGLMIQMKLDNVQIEYRPPRIGFCVRNGNIQDVVTASRLCTVLWGGVYNPIIPVGAPDDLADKLVNVFLIDILVPLAETDEIKSFIEKYKWARFPMMRRNSILAVDGYKKGYKKVIALDISHLLRMLWDKEFKFAKDETSNFAVVSWKSNDPNKDLYPLLFGNYPEEKLSFQYKDSFKKALKAQEINIDPKKSIPALAATVITPIGLTKLGINSWGGGRDGAGVYIGDPKYFLDIVNFWNIRASGNYLAFLPKTNSRRFSPYIKSHISKIKSRGNDFGENRTEISAWFRAETKDDNKEIRVIIKPFETKDRVFSMRGTSAQSWNGLNITPSYHVLGEASCMANIGTKYGKPTVTVHLSDKPIPKRERRFREQFFVVTLKPSVRTEFPEHTTNLPLLPDLNKWYSEQMVLETYRVRAINSIYGATVGLLTDIDRDTIDLHPIPKYELIKKVLERASIIAEKSGAGLVAERLIAIMGGLSGSARIFKITGVRKFIYETNPIHQYTRYEIESWIDDNGSFNSFVGEFGLTTTAQIFEIMLHHNLLKAGVEVRCPKCTLKTWITLNEVDEVYSCEYCQEKSKFVETVEPIAMKKGKEVKIIDGVRWCYRLSGLLGKGDKQQGSLAVILTLQHLENRMLGFSGGEVISSTALDLHYEVDGEIHKAETDLVVLDMSQKAGKEDIEFLIGECKTGQHITRAQIDKLVEVKELIDKSGIKCHLVFTKLKSGFSNAEIGHFKKLISTGIKPVLFTANELEWWWDEYRKFEAKRSNFKLPFEHPFTLDELAENSDYVYNLSEVETKNQKLS